MAGQSRCLVICHAIGFCSHDIAFILLSYQTDLSLNFTLKVSLLWWKTFFMMKLTLRYHYILWGEKSCEIFGWEPSIPKRSQPEGENEVVSSKVGCPCLFCQWFSVATTPTVLVDAVIWSRRWSIYLSDSVFLGNCINDLVWGRDDNNSPFWVNKMGHWRPSDLYLGLANSKDGLQLRLSFLHAIGDWHGCILFKGPLVRKRVIHVRRVLS